MQEIILAYPHFLKWLSDYIITLGFVQIVWTGDAHDAGDENMMKYHVVQQLLSVLITRITGSDFLSMHFPALPQKVNLITARNAFLKRFLDIFNCYSWYYINREINFGGSPEEIIMQI